jgi:hypothetical protein
MSNAAEVIDISPVGASPLIPITQQDVTALKKQREILKKFISSQMKEANFKDSQAEDYGEGDFGVIPGTRKKSLLKPGAEKLLRLFGLGARFRLVDKEIDRASNFAIYTYRCEVYHLRTGVVIAECDGSVNSQEVKYKERTVWRKKKLPNGKEVSESVKEVTPIFDILNTIIKMSQKRALIGATILATSASDFFTQDMEADEDPDATKAQESAPTSESKPKPDGTNQNTAPNADAQNAGDFCCGKKMMVSKYPDRETGEYPLYCTTCKSKRFIGTESK